MSDANNATQLVGEPLERAKPINGDVTFAPEAPLRDVEVREDYEDRPEASVREFLLGDCKIKEEWPKLRDIFEAVLETKVTDARERTRYTEAVATLDTMFAQLEPSEEMRTAVNTTLCAEGFPEDGDSYDILFGSYKDRILSVLILMQNVVEDHLLDVSEEMGSGVYRDEGVVPVMELVYNLSEQYKASREEPLEGSTPSVSIGGALKTPFETYAAEVLRGLGDIRTDEGLLEHVLEQRIRYSRVIQAEIKKTGLYSHENHPWEGRSSRRATFEEGGLDAEAIRERESVAITERDEPFYKLRFQREMHALKIRIREREDQGEDVYLNTWGFDSAGRKQVVESRRFLGRRVVDEASTPQPVYWLDRRVQVHETDPKTGHLRSTVKSVRIACPAIFVVEETNNNLKYGEAGDIKYVAQEVRTVDDLMVNSPVKAQEWLWRLEAAEQEIRGGEVWYKVPVLRNGKPTWLPLSATQYMSWKHAFSKTLRAFEESGLDYVSTKQQQERDDLHVTRGLSDLGTPDIFRTWFDLQLECGAMQDVLDSVPVPDSLNPQYEEMKMELMNAYRRFICTYGQEHEYAARARRIVEEAEGVSGQTFGGEEYLEKYREALSDVVAEYEQMALFLHNGTSSEYDTLRFIADCPLWDGQDFVAWDALRIHLMQLGRALKDMGVFLVESPIDPDTGEDLPEQDTTWFDDFLKALGDNPLSSEHSLSDSSLGASTPEGINSLI
ncbi:hypothetical protein KBG31_00425 [Patescibacteria group bacterium]|nr:hypothetical protein [Patescibacteria group bacterium]